MQSGEYGLDLPLRKDTYLPKERQIRVPVAGTSLPRGRHLVRFTPEPWESSYTHRYVLVTKSGKFAALSANDFHWVASFPISDPSTPTSVVVTIENSFWTFGSDDACITYGVLQDGKEPPKLQDEAPEFESVDFSLVEGFSDSMIDDDHLSTEIQFVPEVDELPAVMHDGYELYYSAFATLDGHEISYNDLSGKKRSSAWTYGESHFAPVFKLLSLLGAGLGDVVVDLGSGTGRMILAAALAFPGLKLCRGIEALPGLHSAAVGVLAQLEGNAPVSLVQGDILTEDWSDATILFIMSLCFSEDMISVLERKVLDLKIGARIITMHCFFGETVGDAFIRPVAISQAEPRHAVSLEMSFGRSTMYVFERVGQLAFLDELD